MTEFENATTQLAELEQAPQTIEFVVDNGFVKKLPEILSNVEKLKQFALAQTEKDRALVLVSDEDFDEARKRCAQLNKVIQGIDGKRKSVKAEYTAPYNTFEKALKEVTSLLTSAKDNLWTQITAAEDKIKMQKEVKYRQYWESLGCTYKKWETIFDSKWLNKGAKEADVYATLDEIAINTKTDMEAIRTLDARYTAALIDFYLQGHTLTEVITYKNRLNADNLRQVASLDGSQANSQETQKNAPAPQLDGLNSDWATNDEPVITIDFRIWATKTQLAALKEFLLANKIKYGKVPTEN